MDRIIKIFPHGRFPLSYNPLHFFDDLGDSECIDKEVSCNDHLARFLVPILYLDFDGGWGSAGDSTSSLSARTDLTYCLVKIPGLDLAYYHGHADLRTKNSDTELQGNSY